MTQRLKRKMSFVIDENTVEPVKKQRKLVQHKILQTIFNSRENILPFSKPRSCHLKMMELELDNTIRRYDADSNLVEARKCTGDTLKSRKFRLSVSKKKQVSNIDFYMIRNGSSYSTALVHGHVLSNPLLSIVRQESNIPRFLRVFHKDIFRPDYEYWAIQTLSPKDSGGRQISLCLTKEGVNALLGYVSYNSSRKRTLHSSDKEFFISDILQPCIQFLEHFVSKTRTPFSFSPSFPIHSLSLPTPYFSYTIPGIHVDNNINTFSQTLIKSQAQNSENFPVIDYNSYPSHFVSLHSSSSSCCSSSSSSSLSVPVAQDFSSFDHLSSTTQESCSFDYLSSTTQESCSFDHLSSSTQEFSSFDHLSSSTQAFPSFDHFPSSTQESCSFDHSSPSTQEFSSFDHLSSSTQAFPSFDHFPSSTQESCSFDHSSSSAQEFSSFDHLPSTTQAFPSFDHFPSTTQEFSYFDHSSSSMTQESYTLQSSHHVSPISFLPSDSLGETTKSQWCISPSSVSTTTCPYEFLQMDDFECSFHKKSLFDIFNSIHEVDTFLTENK